MNKNMLTHCILLTKITCLLITDSLDAARLFSGKDESEAEDTMILGGMSDVVKIIQDDFEKDDILRDVNRNPTAYNRMLGVNSKIISEVMHSRRKRSKGKPGIHKRKRSPSKYERNEVPVPYVPLNMYVHQPEGEYEVLVAEPESDPKIDL